MNTTEMDSNGTVRHRIRASMLPSYADCARRTAGKQYGRMIEAAGWKLRALMPSVGAAVGTATHAAVEYVLREKMRTGSPGRVADGLEIALARLREEIAPGAEWDATTPNVLTAEEQIGRLTRAYLPTAEAVQPLAVELSLAATVGPGWELTGHIDLLTIQADLSDLKTGAIRRPYHGQLGAYSLLARSNGHKINKLGTMFVTRVRIKKPQPSPEYTDYEREACERAAFATIKDIQRDVEQFEKSGNPDSFRANNMSLMCSRRYCPAWGTTFCTLHMKGSEDGNPVD